MIHFVDSLHLWLLITVRKIEKILVIFQDIIIHFSPVARKHNS